MADCLRLKLPSFKVTVRHTSGRDERKIIHPPVSLSPPCTIPPEPEADHSQPVSVDPAAVDTFGIGSIGSDSYEEFPGGSSLHKIQKEASAAAWKRIRQQMLRAVVESEAMPVKQPCIMCMELATLRCRKCGPFAFFCNQCFLHAHSRVNLFHVAEEWKDGVFHPKPIENRFVHGFPQHDCSTGRQAPICCIDEDGLEHNILLFCCDCEPLTVTMVRARLWPASPQFPKLAFSFNLLDWAEALLLECQVAVKEFCGALLFKCPHIVQRKKEFYNALIDAAEEYRFMKQELREPHFLCCNIDQGNVCPACPRQASGKVIVSMDAIFGLPRKKAAGESVRQPLHGHLFFDEQSQVDEYVNSAANVRSSQGCSDFLAGSSIRSSVRFKALDETALFGCVCRHEFPLLFFNLRHGERLAYSVFMAQRLYQKYCSSDEPKQLYLMYDIACVLDRHLKKSDPTLLEAVHLVVPSFHSYGHNASCQMHYSPLQCSGIGLSDGECVERLWSYLRRFARMTKEMRPSHRIDVLAHALAHYARKTTQKMGVLLANRYKRATRSLAVATETLESLLSSSEVPKSAIEKWIEDDKLLLASTKPPDLELSTWKTSYFKSLQAYYALHNSLSCGDGDSKSTDYRHLKKLSIQLQTIESCNGVIRRWTPEDLEYQQAESAYTSALQSSVLSAIQNCSVKRKFLLHMKAKYADGQKIAKRLASQISKETGKIKKLVTHYNLSNDPKLSIDEVLDPQHTVFGGNASKRHDITQAYLRKKRSEEEIELLKAEMEHTLDYLQQKESCVVGTCTDIAQCTDMYSLGTHNILMQYKLKLEHCLLKTKASFKNAAMDCSDEESDTQSDTDQESDYDTEQECA